jgi:hypothetical protein
MFEWVENNPDLGRVDLCVPNAGFNVQASLLEGESKRIGRLTGP